MNDCINFVVTESGTDIKIDFKKMESIEDFVIGNINVPMTGHLVCPFTIKIATTIDGFEPKMSINLLINAVNTNHSTAGVYARTMLRCENVIDELYRRSEFLLNKSFNRNSSKLDDIRMLAV